MLFKRNSGLIVFSTTVYKTIDQNAIACYNTYIIAGSAAGKETVMDAQLKKGIIEMCMLHVLAEGDEYGYPLMQRMKEFFIGTDDSTYYSILRRLAAEGYTETYMGTVSGGPVRKYYKITGEGRNYLDGLEKQWQQIEDVVRQIGIGGTKA